MAGERESVEELFTAALELAPEERTAFLDQACCDHPERKAVVRQMLDRQERMGDFLEEPAFAAHRAAAHYAPVDDDVPIRPRYQPPPSTPSGPRWRVGDILIDRFEIVRYIARGGMGEVYEAEDRRLQGVHVGL